jgi:adenylate cyclase
MTVKGPRTNRAAREVEFPMPLDAAHELLDHLCLRPLIEKTRHLVPAGLLTWEVDVFEGENAGLIIAEVELPAVDVPVPIPSWVGEEVSDDPRYANANLVSRPYSTW